MKFAVVGLFAALALVLPAQQPAAEKKAPPTSAASKAAPAEAPKPAPAPAPAEPAQRRQYNYVYDLNGQPVPSVPQVQEQRSTTGSSTVIQRVETAPTINGGEAPSRAVEERVVRAAPGNETSERTIQRYDPNGRPTGKLVIKSQKQTLPDGSVVSTEVTYQQDLNGNMQFVERRVTNEKKTNTGATATTTVERPSVNGGTQVVERIDRTDTKRGEGVTESVSSHKVLDANGGFTERDRELTIATQKGDVTTTHTKQWQLGATGQLDFVSQTLSHLTQKPDGSQVEDKQVYSTRIAGTTADLNNPDRPTLESETHRERKVQPDGKIIETTTERMREVVDPTRLSGLMKTEQVITPTAQGKSIETTVYQRDANGRVVPVRKEVEEDKK